MTNVEAKLEALVHAVYVARIGKAINTTVAEAVFAGQRPWIASSIAAAITEATADMDPETRERYAAFMLEQLNRGVERARAGTADPLSDALDLRIAVYGERRQ